jgi:hypothetical protein
MIKIHVPSLQVRGGAGDIDEIGRITNINVVEAVIFGVFVGFIDEIHRQGVSPGIFHNMKIP